MRANLRTATDDVDEEEVISLLRDLIKIPSPSEEEEEISEFIAKRMKRYGLCVKVVGGNVVGKQIPHP